MALSGEKLKISTEGRDLALYRCVQCRGRIELVSDGMAQCSPCQIDYPMDHGILDTLVRPGREAVREMQGMAREMNVPIEEWERIKIRMVDKNPDLDELRSRTASDPTAYYDQTWSAFEQATNFLSGSQGQRALEVGAGPGFHFLRRLREKGYQCYALNLRYDMPRSGDDCPWLEKTIGDMNVLPFADSAFDVVLLSATSHHSPDLDKTVREVARVLKMGGTALFLNDQISGWLKFVDQSHLGRDHLIHENYYSIKQYDRLFRKYGLSPRYLFSDFYDQKLLKGDISSRLRFASLGKALTWPWRFQGFRNFAKTRLLWTAHRVLGFPLNVVLTKIKG